MKWHEVVGYFVQTGLQKDWARGCGAGAQGAVPELTEQPCRLSLSVGFFSSGTPLRGVLRLLSPRDSSVLLLLRKGKKFRLRFCKERPADDVLRCSELRGCLLVSPQHRYFPARILQQQGGTCTPPLPASSARITTALKICYGM